jgi:cytochrome c551/c552
MGQFLMNRRLLVVVALSVLIGIVAACAPNPRSQLISPNMVPVGAGEEFVPPTPTPVPNIANLTEEEILQGLDENLVSLLASADPAQGQQLAVANGCIGCHQLDPNQTVVAPSWYDMANAALIHSGADEGPAAYIHHSIVAPNDYVVAGYPAGIMPQTYGETLNDEQLMHIVAYLLTLRGDDTQ